MSAPDDRYTLTVGGVMLDMGRDPDGDIWDRVAWYAGAMVRDRWQAAHDERPVVRLTKKTRGNGTHDKAHYPEEWREVIVASVEAAELVYGVVPDPRQVSMFGAS